MRRFIAYALVCAFGTFGTSLQAQDFPSRPIQVVVPMAAGSGTDIHARILMEELRKMEIEEIETISALAIKMGLRK